MGGESRLGGWRVPIVVAVIGLIGILAGAAIEQWGSYKDRVSAEFNLERDRQLQRLIKVEEQLEGLWTVYANLLDENTDLKTENAQLKYQVGLLQAQVQYGDDSPLSAIFQFIEDLGVAGWCKVRREPSEGYPDGRFEMAFVNKRYQFEYDKSEALYVGATDFDVYPQKIAQAYFDNDMQVWNRQKFMDFWEPVELFGQVVELQRFWKFPHHVEDGPSMVCGWRILDEPPRPALSGMSLRDIQLNFKPQSANDPAYRLAVAQ